MTAPPLYTHQEETAKFALQSDRVVNTSDPGTGKTRATLEGYMRRRHKQGAQRLLVVAPLSILDPSWGQDIRDFAPTLRFAIATQPDKNRRKAFDADADITLINTDGVKWLNDNPEYITQFTDICVDEFSAFKNRSTARSRALLKVSRGFKHRTILSGTPIQNTLTDLWHPVFVLDGGQRLGGSFSKFRNSVCAPEQVGPRAEHIRWVDRPGMQSVVSAALSDITIRYCLEDCLDLPENTRSYLHIPISKKVRKAYNTMRKDSLIELQGGKVTAVNAAVRSNKMLQILTGSVYGEDGSIVPVDKTRYELVAELADERDHSVIAFNWQHEKDAILRSLRARKMTYDVIDGKASVGARTKAVKDFQAGKLRVILCHPAAAAHGLTLTKGHATIWSSATYSSEYFIQLNRRIYRAGQTRKTQTICVCAEDTAEENVYKALDDKLDRVNGLLTLLTA